ncbi:hypothetical protein GCM10023235_14090 [Kitasatospora terrestris]|uniref:Uncharacterized protein n=2 Tax=Kitasatospora terrestris TaxID=258051 RepID=A0ABP9DCV5_9ACTN
MPPLVSRARLDEVCGDILRIADLVRLRDAGADQEIRAFNARTGHDCSALDFVEYEGSRDLAAFALEVARPAWPRVADISTDELVEIVRRILDGDPETDYYLRLLGANVVHPRGGGLIFHPPAGLRGASAELIVAEALGYRPFAL